MASTPTRDLPEEFLAATRKSQETMIRAIKTWVETVRTVTPKLPSAYTPLADRLPKLPSVTVPFADGCPSRKTSWPAAMTSPSTCSPSSASSPRTCWRPPSR